MGKDAPDAPNPKKTGAAQTGTNVGTAIANTMMGFVDQKTPWGKLKYEQSGHYTYKDPYTGKKYKIPTFSATQKLNPKQQAINQTNLATQQNLATLAKDQSSRLSNLLGTPFTLKGLPEGAKIEDLQNPSYQQFAQAPQLATTFDNAGQVNNLIKNAGTINRNVADSGAITNAIQSGGEIRGNVLSGGNITRSIGDAGKITGEIADAGAITRSVTNAEDITRSIQNAGDITRTIEDAGDITKSYGANDFSADRTKVEEALMARMQPYLDKQRAAMDARLANQGVRLGSSAYSAAQDDYGRQVNDATLANILAAGDEQARMVAMDRDRATFQNAAQAQQYSQNANNANFANSAQAQQYGQNANDAAFTNSAQAQQYGQNLSDANFANAAQAQQFSQNAARAAFANEAQAQRYGQNANNATFQNAAQAQSYGQNLSSTELANAAQAQRYQQNANNAAFTNAAQAQRYGQNANNLTLANAAQAQQYQQNANDADFANAAQQQLYGQLLGRTQFANQAAQQNFGNQNQITAQNNAIQTQQFNDQLARMNEQNRLRQQAIDEKFAVRNQPINEISALLGGTQVKDPTWANAAVSQIPTTDYAGIINQDFANRMQAYQAQQAQIGGLLGGIGSLFGALSDRRAKKDIRPAGRLMGYKLHEYRYKGEPANAPKTIGVMADEVARTRPDAVFEGADGLKRVQYGKLFGRGARIAA